MSPSEYRELTTLIANELDRAQEEFRASFVDHLGRHQGDFRAFFVDQLDRCQQEFEAHFMTGSESLRAEIRLLAEAVRQERLAIEHLAASLERALSGRTRRRAVADRS